jgi:hypothetical protein
MLHYSSNQLYPGIVKKKKLCPGELRQVASSRTQPSYVAKLILCGTVIRSSNLLLLHGKVVPLRCMQNYVDYLFDA